MASPACLEKHGQIELVKMHLAVNGGITDLFLGARWASTSAKAGPHESMTMMGPVVAMY
jgi:hypothetical protein